MQHAARFVNECNCYSECDESHTKLIEIFVVTAPAFLILVKRNLLYSLKYRLPIGHHFVANEWT